MAGIPQGAIDAATEVMPGLTREHAIQVAREALEAAEPHIRAAGRERCAQLQAALGRHMQWCEAKDGTKLCGGCLDDWPCPDATLLRDQP